MVKIISGWSDKGGSTFAFINLTNFLNENGIDCIFYGPHDFHLHKCKSDLLKNLVFEENDIIISHFLDLKSRPNVKKIVLSCHEKDIFKVSEIKQYWDEVIFLNEKQRKYHMNYRGKYRILPNLKDKLTRSVKSDETKKVAGVIGSIDENKQTHLSIIRAINNKYEKIILFGNVTDQNYYEKLVKPLIKQNVIEYGFESNKQKIYDMIGAVFLSSKSEVASLVKDECETTGTKFYGNLATDHDTIELTNDEIIKEWINILEI